MGSEGPDVRLPGMSQTAIRRQRPTDEIREATRLTHLLAVTLGLAVKSGRRAHGLTQRALGERVGVQQSWISRIELGHGGRASLQLWVALGVALGRPLAISLSKPLGETRQPADAGHLAMQERLLA